MSRVSLRSPSALVELYGTVQIKLERIGCLTIELKERLYERITTWLDVQHQYMVIAQRAVARPALHAVAAMAATAVIAATAGTGRTHPRPTPRRGVAGAAGAAADPAAA